MKKMKIFEIFFWPLLGVGNEWIGPKNIFWKNIIRKKKGVEKKKDIFLAIYQLKNTSDCIKIDPPGPGRNLKKSQKKRPKILCILP